MTDYVNVPANIGTYTVLTDPDPTQPWTPSHPGDGATAGMRANTDYLINLPYKRGHQLQIKGGRHKAIIGGYLTRDDTNGGPCIMLDGSSTDGGTLYLIGVLGDCSGGYESDFLRTRTSVIPADNTNLRVKSCRIVNLRGQTDGPPDGVPNDDFGNPTSGTHADCFQFAGGIKSAIFEDGTSGSRYANFQLQREHKEIGSYGNIIAITRNTITNVATATTDTPHGLGAGGFVQVGDGVAAGGQALVPGGWNGTYKILTIPANNQFTYNLGDATPSAATTLGTWKESIAPYQVGDITINRWNIYCQLNHQQFITQKPGETINAWRIGARPWFKGYEDKTPMTVEGYDGQVLLNEVYIQTLNLALATLINPGASNVYSKARAQIVNNVITYPNWPAVTGSARAGLPPQGDYCAAWLPGVGFPNAPGFRV